MSHSGDPLSIVHVFRAPVGGLFRHVMDLTREQAARGCSIGIIADSLTGGERADETLREAAPCLALGVHRLKIPRNPGPIDAPNLFTIARILSRIGPDVVHGHGSKGGLYARAPGLLGRKGPIRAYTPHGGSFHCTDGPAGPLYMAMERLLTRATDLFLFESAYMRARTEQFITVPGDRARVTLNGISEAEFAPVVPRPDAADFLYIGELRSAKGVDTLLEAMTKLTANGGPTLNLVGTGPDEPMLRQQVAALGLGERVRFLGGLSARDAFTRGRVLVVPSRAESLPYVVIEAAAAHMPIVATHVGGIPEIMAPLREDLIAPDDADVLASAMARFAAMPEDERKLRAHYLTTFARERFTISAMTTSILEACTQAVAARRAANG